MRRLTPTWASPFSGTRKEVKGQANVDIPLVDGVAEETSTLARSCSDTTESRSTARRRKRRLTQG